MGGSSQQRELENSVRELYLLMQTASEQAVLDNLELGLLLEEDRCRLVAFQDESGGWTPSGERKGSKRTLPEWLTLTEYVDSDAPRRANAEDKLRPNIVFCSRGETTPFEIGFTQGN